MREKFSTPEIESLRTDLLRHGLDSFQVAEAIKMFVARRGYGISTEMARDMASLLESTECSAESLHKQLENAAWVM